MILIRENVERKTSDPLVIARLKKEGFKEYKPELNTQDENNSEEHAEETTEEVKGSPDPTEPKKKRSAKKGGTEND